MGHSLFPHRGLLIGIFLATFSSLKKSWRDSGDGGRKGRIVLIKEEMMITSDTSDPCRVNKVFLALRKVHLSCMMEL
ncbi:MAG: hypothetical protein C4293_09145 [Nitrospiraceae bacterium]